MLASSKSIFVWSSSPIFISATNKEVIPVWAASIFNVFVDKVTPVPAVKAVLDIAIAADALISASTMAPSKIPAEDTLAADGSEPTNPISLFLLYYYTIYHSRNGHSFGTL